MSFYSSCPVCAFPTSRGERQCPRCGWELESSPLLGRLTPEVKAAYEKQLEHARARWSLSQQRIAAQRRFVTAQAKLQRIQRVGQQAHPEVIVARSDAAPPLRQASTPGDPLASELAQSSPHSSWNPLHWWRLYWRSSHADGSLAEEQQGRRV